MLPDGCKNVVWTHIFGISSRKTAISSRVLTLMFSATCLHLHKRVITPARKSHVDRRPLGYGRFPPFQRWQLCSHYDHPSPELHHSTWYLGRPWEQYSSVCMCRNRVCQIKLRPGCSVTEESAKEADCIVHFFSAVWLLSGRPNGIYIKREGCASASVVRRPLIKEFSRTSFHGEQSSRGENSTPGSGFISVNDKHKPVELGSSGVSRGLGLSLCLSPPPPPSNTFFSFSLYNWSPTMAKILRFPAYVRAICEHVHIRRFYCR